ITANSMDINSLSQAQQSCRLLIKKNQEVSLSAPFTLVFQPQELLIRSEYYPLPALNLELAPRKVLTLRMMNPNNYEIQLKVINLQNSRFIFAPVYTGMGAIGYVGNERSFPLQWALQSTPFVQSMTNDEWLISLPAKQEISIDAYFSGKLYCDTEFIARPQLIDSRTQNFPYFTGIHFGFDLQTQFMTHLSGDEWSPNNLLQGGLAPQAQGTRVFWDLFYESVRSKFGTFFQNPLKTQAEFMTVIRQDQIYDRCVVQ
ncbi:hypothetical protein K2X05_12200, partial [bacterium]|nr:hypothetical protein [bacterium]